MHEDLLVDILEMIQVQEGLFDKLFVTQKAILEKWSLGDDYCVYETLEILLSAREKIDGAIECNEYCLSMDKEYSHGQENYDKIAKIKTCQAYIKLY